MDFEKAGFTAMITFGNPQSRVTATTKSLHFLWPHVFRLCKDDFK